MNFIPATLTTAGFTLIVGAAGTPDTLTMILAAAAGLALVGIAALIQTHHDNKRKWRN